MMKTGEIVTKRGAKVIENIDFKKEDATRKSWKKRRNVDYRVEQHPNERIPNPFLHLKNVIKEGREFGVARFP